MNDMKENGFNNEVIETRSLVIGREHPALLIWGVASMSIALLVFFIQWCPGHSIWWAWFALPIIALPLHSAVDKKVDEKYPASRLTPLYSTLSNVSKVTVSLIFITAMLTLVLNFNAFFVILLILTSWCGLSGYMLDYPQLIKLAAVGLVISIAARVHQSSEYVLLWFAAGLFVLLVMPGLDMLKLAKKEIA